MWALDIRIFLQKAAAFFIYLVPYLISEVMVLKIITLYLHIGTRSGQPKQFKILLALYYYIGSFVRLDGVRRDGYQFI